MNQPPADPRGEPVSATGPTDVDADRRLQALVTVEVDLPHRVHAGPTRRDGQPRRRRRTRRWARWASRGGTGVSLISLISLVSLVALFAVGVGLVYAGASVIRTSTDGLVVAPVSDPTAPNYEALLTPTPTLAVLHDLDGEIDAITVLTLPDPEDGGGGVIQIPTRVVVDLPVFGVAPLEAAYDLGSASVQAEAIGDLLNAGITEFSVVDAERWAGLVAPVAPLLIENPDTLRVEGEVRFPAGVVRLDAAGVAEYLQARVEGESDLARLYRHQLVWESWIRAVADRDATAGAVPGELTSGIGRFVRTLAEGPVEVETLPVLATTSTTFGDEPTFRPDRNGTAAMVERLIPFPRTPRPGVRARVRVLNGTSRIDNALTTAALLPPAGVEVVLVGNADRFDIAETTIAYVGDEHRAAAAALLARLGVGRVIRDPRPSDAVDITVTLGSDHE